jgi:hypothetical protein
METISHTAHRNHPSTQRAFDKVKALVAAYGALSAAVLITVVVLAMTGHEVTSFMWGRSGGVLASAVITHWLTVRAARGARWAFRRVRIISVIAPIAIIAVDLIAAALPPWFVVLQIACAIALAPVAFIIPRPR